VRLWRLEIQEELPPGGHSALMAAAVVARPRDIINALVAGVEERLEQVLPGPAHLLVVVTLE
jgi:hypothetical protein